MNTEEWNRKYAESIEIIQKKIPDIKGVLTAYNTNIDAIVHVKRGYLEEILINNSELKKNLISKLEKPSGDIFNIEDLLISLLNCMKSGTAEEWLIRNREVFNWMESKLKYDYLRMGGQAGITANTLAKLNVPNVIVHVLSLPKEQASLFFSNVKIPTRKNDKVVLEKPLSAVRPSDEKMVHYVFEFYEGTHVKIDGKDFELPRTNKFVATYDPKNTELEIDPSFFELPIKDEADRAIISGYHLLKPEYPDGSTHTDKIIRTIHQIKRWKEEKPEFFIHLETGDNEYLEIYASTLRLLCSFIDSFGLNENELMKVASSLKIAAPKSREIYDAVTVFETARIILESLKITIILVHALDFNLAIIKKQEKYSVERIRTIQSSILFGAALAAARAVNSDFNNLRTVKKEINNPAILLSRKGMKEHEHLACFLEKSYGASGKDFLSTGQIELQDYYVLFAVSKLTEKPATTAGLGDSLISGYILGVK